MANASEGTRARRSVQAGSTGKLAGWIRDHQAIIHGLAHLRGRGDDALEPVNAVLALPEINALRCGWELWELLLTEDGDGPLALLLEHLSGPTLELARYAFWGRRNGSELAVVLAEGERW